MNWRETSETCKEAVIEVKMQGDRGLENVGGNKKGDKGMLYRRKIKKKLESGKKRLRNDCIINQGWMKKGRKQESFREREESKNFQPDSVRCCHY